MTWNGLEHKCSRCHRTFSTLDAKRTHESTEHESTGSKIPRWCVECDAYFSTWHGDQQFCSPECKARAMERRVRLRCVGCEETFVVQLNRVPGRKYCDQECFDEHAFESSESIPLPEQVLARGTRDYYHLPDPRGDAKEPLCGSTTETNGSRGHSFALKDPAVYPNRELCPRCVEATKPTAEVVEVLDGEADVDAVLASAAVELEMQAAD